jgi:hypothetical protein
MDDDCAALVHALAEAECLMRPPRTEEDACAIIARITITLQGKPTSDLEFFALAWGTAEGLFCEAFDEADEGQRWAWIDMCEEALRRAAQGLQ